MVGDRRRQHHTIKPTP
ncbi:hypothetical protein F383_35842 [Gossypium arboreum]|uniref:Uncharacterized protein n=1 Tax=Gossypium arboreum TaxID=29729 RepID=A0A0B0PRR5_GOSAR|nr:hypothetical protein F383_35842 [Gossypium arboreum]